MYKILSVALNLTHLSCISYNEIIFNVRLATRGSLYCLINSIEDGLEELQVKVITYLTPKFYGTVY